MKSYLRNAALVVAYMLSGLVLNGSSCDEDKVPSCDEAIDSFYDADCAIIYDGEFVSESEAEDGCEDMKDDADDEDCMKEFNKVAKCFNSAEDSYDCNDCDREIDDLNDCVH